MGLNLKLRPTIIPITSPIILVATAVAAIKVANPLHIGSKAFINSPRIAPGIKTITVPKAKPFNTFIINDLAVCFSTTSDIRCLLLIMIVCDFTNYINYIIAICKRKIGKNYISIAFTNIIVEIIIKVRLIDLCYTITKKKGQILWILDNLLTLLLLQKQKIIHTLQKVFL
ncbi:hypothetical protein SAM_0714 [Streptococcus agalactiae CJB111]|nr:hypothetical protein SAM_0714 [Streptococcus agalactiae CJB111]EAO78228.1 hypothetical protein SAI_0759 [Streptococcus agalactiae H36B]